MDASVEVPKQTIAFYTHNIIFVLEFREIQIVGNDRL